MFLVARRTKYRVVEVVQDENSPPTPPTQPTAEPPTLHARHGQPLSQSTAYPNSSNPSLPTPDINNHSPSQPTPPEQATSVPAPSLPDFSLQSFLQMAQGNPQNAAPSSSATTSWAHQLQSHGVFQVTNAQRQTTPLQRRNRPCNLGFSSTPLDPTEVPAEDLNVYWEDERK